MTLSQFNCPHCSNPFQVDTSLPSLQVACPHCQQPVALMGEPPVTEPPVTEPPVTEPPVTEPPVTEPPVTGPPVTGPPAFDPPTAAPPIAELQTSGPSGYLPAELLPPETAVPVEETMPERANENDQIVSGYRFRQVTADERASRKFVKMMIVWVCCAIVLVSILAFFLMQNGS